MHREAFEAAISYQDYLAGLQKNRELWLAIDQHVEVDPEKVTELATSPHQWRLLVIAAEWCGDAVNLVPVLGRLAARVPNLEMRVIDREANPALMDAHLTNGGRAIPVAILLDEEFHVRGVWGPRPAPLQQWFWSDGQTHEKGDRYRELRRWYANDRGRTTVREVVDMVRRAEEEEAGRWGRQSVQAR